MNFARTYLLLLLNTYCVIAFAQQNRPVADDATVLMNLLKKDYHEIENRELRLRAIVKDRNQVINILKSYVNQSFIKTATNKVASGGNGAFENQIELQISRGDLRSGTLLVSAESIDLVQKTDTYALINENANVNYQELENINAKLRVASDTKEIGTLKNDQNRTLGKIETQEYVLGKYHLRILQSVFENDHKNLYISDITSQFIIKYKTIQSREHDFYAETTSAASIQKSLPFFGSGSLSFEDGMDGLARFLAKRFKEELTTQIFARIKEALENPDPEKDKFLELKILLPRTCKFISNLDQTDLTGMLDALKAQIEFDLDHLIDQLPKLDQSPKIKRLLNKNEDLLLALEGLKLIRSLSKSNHPLDYIDALANSNLINQWSDEDNLVTRHNIAQGIKLSSLLVNCFTVKQTDGRNWIHPEFWTSYASDINFYKAFLGLMLQQDILYYNIQISGRPFADLVRDKYSTLTSMEDIRKKVEPQFKKLLMSAEQLNNQITAIKKIKRDGNKIKGDTLYQYINNVINIIQQSVASVDALVDFLAGKDLNLVSKTAMYFEYGRKSNEILLSIHKKQYADAITSSLDIFYAHKENPIDTSVYQALKFAVNFVDEIKNGKNPTFNLLMEINSKLSSGSPLSKENASEFVEMCKQIGGYNLYQSKLSTLSGEIDNSNPNYALLKLAGKFLENASEFDHDKFTAQELIFITDLKMLLDHHHPICDDHISKMKSLLNKMAKPTLKAMGTAYDAIKNLGSTSINASNDYNNIKAAYETLKTQKDEIYLQVGLYIFNKGLEKLRKDIVSEKLRLEALQCPKRRMKWKTEVYQQLIPFVDRLRSANKTLMVDYNTSTYLKSIRTAFEDVENEVKREFYQLAVSGLSAETRGEIERYVNFLAAIAKAKTAEDAEHAIEALALPAGSSAIKRNSMFNVALNSYPGLFVGVESEFTENKHPVSIGFTAPVGVAISGRTKKRGSNSFYITIIDIGALTRVHLSGDDPGELPEFTFKNVLAPGLHYVYGFKNGPLSLISGLQYGPQLKSLEGADKGAFRVGLGLTVDIPILNFYTSSQ